MTTSQKNWLDLLDSVQFAYNLYKSSSTRMSPFKLAMGQQPLTPHEIAKQRLGGRYQVSCSVQICHQQARADAGGTRQLVESAEENEEVC